MSKLLGKRFARQRPEGCDVYMLISVTIFFSVCVEFVPVRRHIGVMGRRKHCSIM